MIKMDTDFSQDDIVDRIEKSIKSSVTPGQMKTCFNLIEQAVKMNSIDEKHEMYLSVLWEKKAREMDAV